LLSLLIAISASMSHKTCVPAFPLSPWPYNITSVITVTVQRNKERVRQIQKQLAACLAFFPQVAFVWEKDLSHGDLS